MGIDIGSFGTRVRLRELAPTDYAAVVALQLKCFPRMKPWREDQFESQVSIFPEGQIGIEVDGELVASASSLVVDYADYAEWHDWMKICGGGYIKNHDPDGDTLYGIEMQVDPECRGMRLARRMYDYRKDLCRRRNLARMMIGGRMPGYAKHASEMTPQEYVNRVMAGTVYDQVLTAQLANGFVLKQIIPDYLPSDEDSAGYATHLEWSNLDYKPPRTRRARRAIEVVRVGFVQYQMRQIASFDDFSTQATFFVDTASDTRADILVFPELFTLQLLSVLGKHAPGAAARELAKFTPQYLELFNDLAIRYNVNIIGGSMFSEEGGHLYNVSYLFRRDGTIEKQAKLHVTPNERRWWGVTPGDRLRIFDTDCGPLAIFICYDIQFPELARIAAEQGARLFFVPYNTNDRYGHLRVRACAQARSIENHVYVVTSGCVGNLPFVENADIHYAQSGIYTPSDVSFARDGIAVEASPNLETVLCQDLDLELLRKHRRAGTVQNWADRRTDLYRILWLEPDGSREI
jgi:predicted amidohydrolase/ribosomal protein S18 acetylase RimI-like enzyme